MALARTLRPGKDYVRLTHQGEVFEGEVWAVDTCGRTTELQLMLADGMRVLTVDSETPCEVLPQSPEQAVAKAAGGAVEMLGRTLGE